MRILLINPDKFCQNILDKWEQFLTLGNSPILGLGYISALPEKEGHKVRILDMSITPISFEKLAKMIKVLSPDLVGIYLTLMTIKGGQKVAKIIKKEKPNLPIIVGGQCLELFPEEIISSPYFDYALQGEADYTFLEFLNYLNKKGEKPKGLVFKENGEIKIHGTPPFIQNLDILPFPSRHLFKSKYSHIAAKKSPYTSAITSRGCPYRCAFCSKVPAANHLRMASAHKVVEEFEVIKRQGYKEINFFDDTFTIDRKRVIDISKGLIKKGINLSWAIRTRADRIDKEMLYYLKKAGCYRLHIGVESGSNEILKKMNKMIDKKDVKKGFELSKKMGFERVAYFMLGFPGETEETMEETAQFIKEIELDYLNLSIFIPMPASSIYEELLSRKIETPKKQWIEYIKGERDEMPEYFSPLSKEEILEFYFKIIKDFHLNFKNIFHFLNLINSQTRFFNYSKAGLKVLISLLRNKALRRAKEIKID